MAPRINYPENKIKLGPGSYNIRPDKPTQKNITFGYRTEYKIK